jgi:carboxymethylenebutenolidase
VIVISGATADIAVPGANGTMRLRRFQRQAEGAFPGVVLVSELYQITAPIRRLAAFDEDVTAMPDFMSIYVGCTG